MVVYSFNPNIWEADSSVSTKFEDTHGYIVEPVSKKYLISI